MAAPCRGLSRSPSEDRLRLPGRLRAAVLGIRPQRQWPAHRSGTGQQGAISARTGRAAIGTWDSRARAWGPGRWMSTTPMTPWVGCSISGTANGAVASAFGDDHHHRGGHWCASDCGGDGGPATQATTHRPQGIAVGPDGSLYIADSYNHRIRRVGPDGIITTVAGTDVPGFGGDGGPATQATLDYPQGIAVGPDGSLYIADSGNNRIRRVGPDGIITTVAGTDGSQGFGGDGGPATQARLAGPWGIAFGPDGSLYIADSGNQRIRRVGPDGIITTVAGTGQSGFSGDGGPATQARLIGPGESPSGRTAASTSRIPAITASAGWARTGSSRRWRAASTIRIRWRRRAGHPGDSSTTPRESPSGRTAASTSRIPAILASAGWARTGSSRRWRAADTDWIRRRRRAGHPGDTLLPRGNRRRAGRQPLHRRFRTIIASARWPRPCQGSRSRRSPHPFRGRQRALSLQCLGPAPAHPRCPHRGGALSVRYDAKGQPRPDQGCRWEHHHRGARRQRQPHRHRRPHRPAHDPALDANGYLASITSPGGQAVQLTSTADGLLTRRTDPGGGVHNFSYDSLGRLARDEGPDGNFTALVLTDDPDGYTVKTTTASGLSSTYQVEHPRPAANGGPPRTTATVATPWARP